MSWLVLDGFLFLKRTFSGHLKQKIKNSLVLVLIPHINGIENLAPKNLNNFNFKYQTQFLFGSYQPKLEFTMNEYWILIRSKKKIQKKYFNFNFTYDKIKNLILILVFENMKFVSNFRNLTWFLVWFLLVVQLELIIFTYQNGNLPNIHNDQGMLIWHGLDHSYMGGN